jgi:3-oxoadipate enol-lactonase
MEFTTVSGVTIHYASQGEPEASPLVFVNSLGTDLRSWDKVVASLGNRFRLVRYDKRGHGLSDCPPAPYSIRDHTLDLVHLLDYLDIGQTSLVGISVGGMIAQDFAAAWPDRVRSLVLSDTAPTIGTAAMWNDRIRTLRQNGMASMSAAILARWFAPSYAAAQPAAYQAFGNMLTRMPLEGYTGTCEAIRDADLSDAARTIQAPTLVLCGQEDSATPPSSARRLCELIPQAIYREIPDAGHLPCIEQPEVMAAHVAGFV